MSAYTVSPYLTDYTKAGDASDAWRAGKDFTLETIDGRPSRWSGKPISVRDTEHGDTVSIRYSRLRRSVWLTGCATGVHPPMAISYHADRAECQECGETMPLPVRRPPQ